MRSFIPWRRACWSAAAAFLLALGGCGGGDDPPPAPPPSSGVGPAGGTVTGPDGAAVNVPAGALSTTVGIAIARSAAGAPALPADREAAGSTYVFTPHGTAFSAPVTVTVPFDPASVPSGQTPQLFKTNAAQSGWEPVAGATVAGTAMTAQVTSFSWFVVTRARVVAPSITAHPQNQTVTAGQTATFSVTAAGSAPLSYQWRRNGTDIAGATASTYTTPATTLADNGAQFTVVVSNAAGSVTSNPATLTVQAAPVPPSITAQPQSASVTEGQTATFTVTATGTAPLSYQWRRNGTAIAGATASTYTTPATTLADNGAQFTVVVSNAAGSVTSNPATLTVTPASNVAGNPRRVQAVVATHPGVFRIRAAVSPAGRATLVWVRGAPTGFDDHIETSSSTDGLAWTVPLRLTTGTGARSAPSVAQAGNGDLFVAWYETVNSVKRAAVVRYSAATASWSAPHYVGNVGASSPGEPGPGLAADADGNALLLAAERPTGSPIWRTVATRFDAATSAWSPAAFIENYSSPDEDAGGHRIAMDSQGNAIAVWARINAAGESTVYARFDRATGTWSAPAVFTGSSSVFQVSGLGLADNGTAMLLTHNRVWRFNGTSWTDISAGLPQVTVANARLAVAADGTNLLVMREGPVGSPQLRARRYSAGTWSAAVTVPDSTGVALGWELAMNAAGDAVLVWNYQTNRRASVARLPAASNVWGSPQPASTTASLDVLPMAAALAASGRAVLGWREFVQGSGDEVWGNVLP
ncbi:MAG: immunoglobulin domain-containing protein [Burkholderiaceae bacterium]|nr:immunoglobulin domain-containing protein [Burkholderiaceae bacterium]